MISMKRIIKGGTLVNVKIGASSTIAANYYVSHDQNKFIDSIAYKWQKHWVDKDGPIIALSTSPFANTFTVWAYKKNVIIV